MKKLPPILLFRPTAPPSAQGCYLCGAEPLTFARQSIDGRTVGLCAQCAGEGDPCRADVEP